MEELLETQGARTIKSENGLYFDAIPATQEIIISRFEYCLAVFPMEQLIQANDFYEKMKSAPKAKIN